MANVMETSGRVHILSNLQGINWKLVGTIASANRGDGLS